MRRLQVRPQNGYQVAVQVDADGQHDPAEIPSLPAELQYADVVVGTRFAGRGAFFVSGPRKWAIAALARSAARRAQQSSPSHLRLPRLLRIRAGAVRLFAQRYPVEYLGDTVEVLIMACQADLRVRQVPVEMRVRQAGVASQTPLRASLYLLRAILAMAVSDLLTGQDSNFVSRPVPLVAGA